MLSTEGDNGRREQMGPCLLPHLQHLPPLPAVAPVALSLHGQEQAALGFLLLGSSRWTHRVVPPAPLPLNEGVKSH